MMKHGKITTSPHRILNARNTDSAPLGAHPQQIARIFKHRQGLITAQSQHVGRGFVVALNLTRVLVDVTDALPPGTNPNVVAIVFEEGKNEAIDNVAVETPTVVHHQTVGG